jgi:hypothetical protein
VLDGKTPNQVVAERLKVRRKLARGKPEGRAGPDDVAKARLIAEDAKEVSQPHNVGVVSGDVSHGRFEGIITASRPLQDILHGTAERGHLYSLHSQSLTLNSSVGIAGGRFSL